VLAHWAPLASTPAFEKVRAGGDEFRGVIAKRSLLVFMGFPLVKSGLVRLHFAPTCQRLAKRWDGLNRGCLASPGVGPVGDCELPVPCLCRDDFIVVVHQCSMHDSVTG